MVQVYNFSSISASEFVNTDLSWEASKNSGQTYFELHAPVSFMFGTDAEVF